MKIAVAIIGIIISLALLIFSILEIPKRIKEYKLTGKVDYDPETGSCAFDPQGRITLYFIFAGLSSFALACFISILFCLGGK